MNYAAITSYVDWAQIILYVFWIAFAGIVYYLQRESKREGFPLEHHFPDGRSYTTPGLLGMPSPKTFLHADGSQHTVPNQHKSPQPLNARPMNRYNGAPLEPKGNPLTAGVGPGAWADRADKVEMTPHGQPVIVPLRVATDHNVSPHDTNPIGLPLIDAERQVAGKVTDLWVDRSEMIFRLLEAEIPLPGGGKRSVLVPWNFCRVSRGAVQVNAVMASQFVHAPTTKSDRQITMLEEEKLMAFYGAGTLYATPDRQEVIL